VYLFEVQSHAWHFEVLCAKAFQDLFRPTRAHEAITPLPCLLQEFGDQCRPAGLMTGAQTDSSVAVEILVKEDQVTPVRVALVPLRRAGRRARPIRTSQEQIGEPPRQFCRDLTQREPVARAGRALYSEVVAVVVMESLQCFNDQVIEGEPDRPAPV
jgi:hypothetical protein